MSKAATVHLIILLASWCVSCSNDGMEIVDAGMDGGLEPDAGEPAIACNGHAELCDRRFDEVTFPMTHNAMSNAEAEWLLPNQRFGISRQLADGVRGLMLDTYEEEGELLLCHVYCSLGSQPLVDGLQEIATFLLDNPNEVVSIIFENYITHEQTAGAFEQSGLIDYVYAHRIGDQWPTLGSLIEADTRLVVFQEKLPLDPAIPWLMNVWDHAWETPFSFASPEELRCDPNRGDPANPLFLLNHFLTGPFGGSAEFAEMINYDPLFIDRANQCELEADARINFVAVDFYDIGDLFEVVDRLNGL